MNRSEVEDILESLKTSENEEIVAKLLEKVKLINDVLLQNAIKEAGGTKEAITEFFKKKISEMRNNNTHDHIPINEMFSYGIAGDCIHLHLPMDLHSLISERGLAGTIDTVNLYLLDAIDKIKNLRDSGFDRFQGKRSIYMISPILLGRELKYLSKIDFETRAYKKKDLNSEEFLKENPEATLATRIFGTGKNIGTAKIDFDVIDSDEWQEKKSEELREFFRKGITFLSKNRGVLRTINDEELEGLERVGYGKCADIYRKGNIVYKILKKDSDSIRFYDKEKLQQLAGIESNLCVFPNEVLVDYAGNLQGYTMDFVAGKSLKDIIGSLPFDKFKQAIEKMKFGVNEVSKKGIIFEDLHEDNLMWNEETQSIQIIDTDFFEITEETQGLASSNFEKLSMAIKSIIDSRISMYGRKENEQLIPFYNLEAKGGKSLSISEYIFNLKLVMEKDFGREFNTLNEIEEALQGRQDEIDDEQHLEQVASNLTIKEKIIRFLAQNEQVRKLPFIRGFIDRKVKMLPLDVQAVINMPNDGKMAKIDEISERKVRFDKELKNWKTQINPVNEGQKINTAESRHKKAEKGQEFGDS